MKNYCSSLLLFSVVFFTGCSTYHLSTQSLLEQFAGTGTEKKTTFLIVVPYVFFPGVVKGNDLRTLKCVDKDDKEKDIPVTNRTQVRITKLDSTITGSKTHFMNAQIKPIKFRDILKIEVQE
jgi:hypothetical protein